MQYLIQDGDTLSELAQAHGTTVDELMALNPSITDPDLIIRQRTLTLPDAPKTEQTAAEATSGKQPSPTETQPSSSQAKPLTLLECTPQPTGAGISKDQAAPHPCQDKRWADIIYLSGTGTFWLLTDDVAESLHEAADALLQIVSDSDPHRRMERLSGEAGLADCLMPARPESFLDEAQQEEYAGIVAELDELDARPTPKGAARRRPQRRRQSLKANKERLENIGRAAAQKAGYIVDSGSYYGPWEEEIEAALETYRQCRRDYVTRPADDERTIAEVLKYAIQYTGLCSSGPPDVALQYCPIGTYSDYLQKNNRSVEAVYIQSILQLAAMGIATPELALAAPTRQTPGLDPGVSAFDSYNQLLGQLPPLVDSIVSKLEDWNTNTTGNTGNAGLPVFLLSEERQQYERYCTQLDAIYETAKRTTEAATPRRVLYWNADVNDTRHALGYRKRSIDVVVRNDFALREFSSPLGPQALSHISLHQLAQLAMTAEEYATLSASLSRDGVLPARLWDAPDTALSQWLTRRGCQRIDWRGAWHEPRLGLFEPEHFFAHLDSQAIRVASLEGRQQAWGKTLQHMLFTGPAHEVLRLFDASAQAQYLRMVGMSYGDLKDQAAPDQPQRIEARGPQLDLKFMEGSVESQYSGASLSAQGPQRQRIAERTLGSDADTPSSGQWQVRDDNTNGVSGKVSASASVEAKFNLVSGELSLGAFALPDEAEARPLTVSLSQRDGEQRDLGCYSLRLEAVAKGFAGASLALSSEAGLSLDRNGLSLSSLDLAQRQGTAASFGAFVGVGVGVECSVTLRWKPPRDILVRLPKYAALDELGLLEQSLDTWGDLSKATVAGEALAGAGFEVDFQIGLVNGRFVLSFKARLILKGGLGGKFSVELDPHRLDVWMAMLHQALVDNEYEPVDWITPEAFAKLSKLSYLASVLLVDVSMLALRGIDAIDTLYEAFTRSDRAGPMAYVLATRDGEDQKKIRAWVQQLPPEALGPLLNVLVSPPKAFEVKNARGGRSRFNARQARDFQQIAITNCLKWLVEGVTRGVYGHASHSRFSKDTPNPAQMLFEKSIARMSSDGMKTDAVRGQAYCENRYRLDKFMKTESGTDDLQAMGARNKYQSLTKSLGLHIDGFCEVTNFAESVPGASEPIIKYQKASA